MSLNIYGRIILILRSQLRFIVESLLPNVLVLWVVLYCFFCPRSVLCPMALVFLDYLFVIASSVFSNANYNNNLASAVLEIKKIQGLVSVLEVCAIHKEIKKMFFFNFLVNCTYTTYWTYPKVDA